MKEGVILWTVFTGEGKAALRMDNEIHAENGKIGHGRLLSPDVPVLHEILTPDNAYSFLSLSEIGVWIRIRMRLRYPGTEDSAVKQSEYEPEMCFPAWIAGEKTGRISLFLQEPSTGICAIPDMVGIPGLPDLQPDSVPVKVEMLIRKASPLLEHPEYSEDIKKRADRKSNLMKEGVLVWIMFTAGEKAVLYANDRIHFTEDGKYVPGKLLSSDISPFHQIYDWDVQYPWIRSKPEISVRYRIRLRYPGANDAGIEQSEYEPEACFPAWIVPQEGGQTGLCLEEPSTGQYFIPDMTGLPGLPELQPDGIPLRVELLIRQAHWISDAREITEMKVENILLYDNGMYLEVPGRKAPSYVPEDAAKVLLHYLEVCQPQGYLFRNRRGDALNLMYISRMLKKYEMQAGIPCYSAQSIRNTCGVTLFAYGANEEETAGQLGVTVKQIHRYKNLTYRENLLKSANKLVRIAVIPPE